MKKPSLKGVSHVGHLGHFAKDKFIQMGHNDIPDSSYYLSKQGVPSEEISALVGGNGGKQAEKSTDQYSATEAGEKTAATEASNRRYHVDIKRGPRGISIKQEFED